jgi:hypothetical protein
VRSATELVQKAAACNAVPRSGAKQKGLGS